MAIKFGEIIFWVFQFVCFSIVPLFAQTVDFGRVRNGHLQKDTLKIVNDKMVDMMIMKTTISDTVFALPPSPFSGALSQLIPGEQRALLLGFTPNEMGNFTGQLHIETSLGDLKWNLKGEGVKEVVVINEILADPPSGIAGDANGDGVRNSNEDEFVELLNTGKFEIDMGGWQLFDSGASENNRLTFPPLTKIAPNERVVVFGGGTPEGISGQVFVDDGRIGGGLRNSGDALFIFDPGTQDTVAKHQYGSEGGKNASLVRWPEGIGAFQKHLDFPGTGVPFSPNKPRVIIEKLNITPIDTPIVLGDTVQLRTQTRLSHGQWQDSSNKELTYQITPQGALERVNDQDWLTKWVGAVEVQIILNEVLADTLLINIQSPGFIEMEATFTDSIVLVGDTISVAVKGLEHDGVKTVINDGYQLELANQSIIKRENGRLIAMAVGEERVLVRFQDFLQYQNITITDWGDLNGDGAHTLWDAIRVIHLILGIATEAKTLETRAADVTQDGHLDIQDLIAVIQRIWGKTVTASKPVYLDHRVGVEKVGAETNIYVLPQTVAISFDLKNIGQNLTFRTLQGDVFVTSDGETLKGVIMLNPGVSSQNEPVVIKVNGLIQSVGAEWVAWKMDGSRYALSQVGEFPSQLNLIKAYPNPMNPESVIVFEIPTPQNIELDIFQVTGQWVCRLAGGQMPAGRHQITWDGRNGFGGLVGSGLYFVHLKGVTRQSTLKMMVLR